MLILCVCVVERKRSKVVPVHTTKVYRGNRCVAPPIVKLGCICR